MTDPRRLIAAVLALTLTAVAGRATAQELAPAIVFDMGGKFDKSFNEAAYNGAEKFKKESGVSYAEFEITNESQREQSLRKLAQRGATVIVATGFAQAPALKTVAAEFPKVKFVIIDDVTLVRSMTTDSVDHEAALRLIHSGKVFPGRPAWGSWVLYGLGSERRELPAYVVLSDPGGLPVDGTNNWSSGFLPAVYQGTPFRAAGTPVAHLANRGTSQPL
jgi:hypothetical protein